MKPFSTDLFTCMFYPKFVTENDAEPMCNDNKTISYILPKLNIS